MPLFARDKDKVKTKCLNEIIYFICHSFSTSFYFNSITLTVNGKNILEAAEGNGPVAALDAALRKALVNFYPQIADFELTDYNHIVDENYIQIDY